MPPRKKTSEPPAEDGVAVPFEDAMTRLEAIVEELEGGELSLEDSLARYEEGMKLSRTLARQLNQAEKRIERLVEARDAGEGPTTRPFEADDEADANDADDADDAPGRGTGELPF